MRLRDKTGIVPRYFIYFCFLKKYQPKNRVNPDSERNFGGGDTYIEVLRSRAGDKHSDGNRTGIRKFDQERTGPFLPFGSECQEEEVDNREEGNLDSKYCRGYFIGDPDRKDLHEAVKP